MLNNISFSQPIHEFKKCPLNFILIFSSFIFYYFFILFIYLVFIYFFILFLFFTNEFFTEELKSLNIHKTETVSNQSSSLSM